MEFPQAHQAGRVRLAQLVPPRRVGIRAGRSTYGQQPGQILTPHPHPGIDLPGEVASLTRCPYDDCSFEGTEAEVDDHIVYMVSMNDPDHRQEDR